MGRITLILQCQWRAYWRRFVRSGTFNRGNQGIVLIFSVLILVRYVQALSVASRELALGKSLMLEKLLGGLFIVWLFPLMSNARLSITTDVLKHLPLSLKELFVIKTGSLFIAPFTWLLCAASVAICYPLFYARNPLAGALAIFLFISTSWFIGLTAAELVGITTWRKSLLGVFLVALIGVTVYVATTTQPLRPVRLGSLSPFRLVARAAFGESLGLVFSVLAGSLSLAACAALGSFRFGLENVAATSHQRKTIWFSFPGPTGPLSAKDIRYFARLLDPYLGLLISIMGCFYLSVAEELSREVFCIFILVAFFPNASLAFNCFGLDNRSATDRYSLLPLTGREVMLSKNVSYFAIVTMQLIPILLFAAFRLGLVPTLGGVVVIVLSALAYLVWGNTISVNHRFAMQFFRFSSGGSPIDALVGVIFGTVPGAIAIVLFQRNLWWVSLTLIIFYALLYGMSLIWAGRTFERRVW